MRLDGLKRITGTVPLRITLGAGLICFVIAGTVLAAFYFLERSSTKSERRDESFSRALREYDIQAALVTGTDREYERLGRDLDRIEKTAIGVEAWLSVLKRRRALSNGHLPSMANYQKSINSASNAFPMSQPIAAIAAEAMLRNRAITREAEEELRGKLHLITDISFNTLRIGLHVMLGDFRNPQRAQVIPSWLLSDGSEAVSVNFIILKILNGETKDAGADIQMMMQSIPLSEDGLIFAAEYYYDFGELERSAEIFSRINTEKALLRQADALYLAGFAESARSIWHLLAFPSEQAPEAMPNERSLYNLAVSAGSDNEAIGYLEKLVNNSVSADKDSRQAGLIRYSRMLDFQQAISVLKGTQGLEPANFPLIDLEINRRQAAMWELGRQFAEAWILLDRHPENEDMYNWAAWLFLFQRNYSEIKILLNRMERMGFDMQWVKSYRAIQLMFEGDLDTADKILRSIPAKDAEWYVHANIARILEAQRSPLRALEQYELAAAKTENPRTAARIQMRIARCNLTIGNESEAIRALLIALDYDPDNLAARLELDRLLR